jgi:hypothetical protein
VKGPGRAPLAPAALVGPFARVYTAAITDVMDEFTAYERYDAF